MINFSMDCIESLIINEVGSTFKNSINSYYKSLMLYNNYDVSIDNYMEMVFDELEDVGIVISNGIVFNDNYYNNFYRLFEDVYNNEYFGNYRLGKVVLDFIINSSMYSSCGCYYNKDRFSNKVDIEYNINLIKSNIR